MTKNGFVHRLVSAIQGDSWDGKSTDSCTVLRAIAAKKKFWVVLAILYIVNIPALLHFVLTMKSGAEVPTVMVAPSLVFFALPLCYVAAAAWWGYVAVELPRYVAKKANFGPKGKFALAFVWDILLTMLEIAVVMSIYDQDKFKIGFSILAILITGALTIHHLSVYRSHENGWSTRVAGNLVDMANFAYAVVYSLAKRACIKITFE